MTLEEQDWRGFALALGIDPDDGLAVPVTDTRPVRIEVVSDDRGRLLSGSEPLRRMAEESAEEEWARWAAALRLPVGADGIPKAWRREVRGGKGLLFPSLCVSSSG